MTDASPPSPPHTQAARNLSVTRDALGGVPAQLEALRAAAGEQLAFQIEQQRVIDATEAALEAAALVAARAVERAAQLAPMAERALEAAAELDDVKPRLARSQAECEEARGRLLRLEAEAARATERADGMRDEIAEAEAARSDAETRAGETREALEEADFELTEWRCGNVRVATYQRWKEARASGKEYTPPHLQRATMGAANLAFDQLAPDKPDAPPPGPAPSVAPSVLNLSLGAVAER